MKLFKKLAAVAVAAVLALSMVGCGTASAGTSYKTELTNLLKDFSYGTDQKVENTKALDDAATVLLKNAQAEYGKLDADAQKTVNEETIVGWLTADEAIKKANLAADKHYYVSATEDPSYASSIGNQFKYFLMMEELIHNKQGVGSNDAEIETKNQEVGFAQGKIGDKSYVVMVFNGSFGD